MRTVPTAAALVCVVAASLGAWQTFRSSVEYVRLDVVVTDKSDRPVTGLTQNDFVVSENSRPQSIATFEAVSIPSVRTVTTTVSVPSVDVVSNRPPAMARQWVLVIDDLHIIELHLRQTKRVVTEFLEMLPPADQVAVVFVGRSDLSQGFTSDHGALMRTVDRIKDSLGFAHDAADGPPQPRTFPAKDIGDKMGPAIDAMTSERHRFGEATIDVLNNVTRAIADSPATRKALVYVSEGANYSTEIASTNEYDFLRDAEFARDYLDKLQKAFTIARRAGAPVYTIDPRGLPDETAVRGWGSTSPSERGDVAGNIRRQQQNMRAIAENTGGLAFVGMSDLTRAIETLVHDNDNFYLIGFYPEPLARDGKFHDVAVTIKGRPELRVRARAGYTAPAEKPAVPLDLDAAFTAAMGAALPTYGLTLRAQAAPLVRGNKGIKTAVTLQVSYPVSADRRKINDTLEYSAVALDAEGKIKASQRKTFHFTATTNATGEATFSINDVIELPTQALTLRVGVASRDLGKIGVIHLPVEPMKLGSDEVDIGAVLLGYNGAAREEAKPKDAFAGLVPFQPTTDRVFGATDVIRVFAPVSWRGNGAVTVALSISQGDRSIVRKTDQLVAASADPGSGRNLLGVNDRSYASFGLTLPMTAVPAGDYLLSVVVTGTGRPARRDVAFALKR